MREPDQRAFATGVVLGASSGIGAAVVRRLAPRTARLHAASRGAVPDGGDRVVHHACDVRRYDEVAGLLVEVGDRLDFVVNCVGVGYYAPLEADFSDAWREITETNLVGLANVLTALHRVCPGTSTYVQVSSLAAHRGSLTSGNTMYAATKAGARVLLDDHRRQVRSTGRPTRIMSVSPGYVVGTGFAERFFEHDAGATHDLFAGQPALTGADVARVVEQLLDSPTSAEYLDVLLEPRKVPA